MTAPAPGYTPGRSLGVRAQVSGTPQVGQTLTASAPQLTSPAYQWKRDGANIAGATSSTYTLVTADLGHAVTCTVTGSYAAPSGAVVIGTGTSNAVTVVDNGDGTATYSGSGVTDNGDGTFTLAGAGLTDNGNGTFDVA